MGRSLEASFFVSEPPEISFVGGLFHVVENVGGERIERVYQPSTFARAIWRAEQALALFRHGANVVQIGAKVPDEVMAG